MIKLDKFCNSTFISQIQKNMFMYYSIIIVPLKRVVPLCSHTLPTPPATPPLYLHYNTPTLIIITLKTIVRQKKIVRLFSLTPPTLPLPLPLCLHDTTPTLTAIILVYTILWNRFIYITQHTPLKLLLRLPPTHILAAIIFNPTPAPPLKINTQTCTLCSFTSLTLTQTQVKIITMSKSMGVNRRGGRKNNRYNPLQGTLIHFLNLSPNIKFTINMRNFFIIVRVCHFSGKRWLLKKTK